MAAEFFDNPTQGRKDLDESIPVKEQLMFEFQLGQEVVITISGEQGSVKARAEYLSGSVQYYIFYKDATGRALSEWVEEADLMAH